MVDLKADFSDEFSWNTKQIFLFLTVEYASRAKPVNQLTMWSRILHKVCQVYSFRAGALIVCTLACGFAGALFPHSSQIQRPSPK